MIEFLDFPWWAPGLLTMCAFTAMVLAMKGALRTLASQTATTILISGITVGFVCAWWAAGAVVPSGIVWWLMVLMVLANTCGNWLDFYAVKYAPNPGYAGAIKAGQIVLVTVVAVLVLGSATLSVLTVFFALLTVVGIVLVSGVWRYQPNVHQDRWWVGASFGALLSFAVTVLTIRAQFDLFVDATKLEQTLFLGALLWGGTALLLIASGALAPRHRDALNRRVMLWLGMAIVAGLVANASAYLTVSVAPNPGYASALKGAQIVPLTLLAPLIFRENSVSWVGLCGVLLVAAGVVGLILFG